MAAVRWSAGTRCGTDASFAGDHSSVKTSSTSEAITRPNTLVTNGSVTITPARPRSHTIINRFRFHRSTKTPATGPRKNPGMMRAESTRLMAAPLFPPPTWAASAVMASSPSQSPVADTTGSTTGGRTFASRTPARANLRSRSA